MSLSSRASVEVVREGDGKGYHSHEWDQRAKGQHDINERLAHPFIRWRGAVERFKDQVEPDGHQDREEEQGDEKADDLPSVHATHLAHL